MAAARNKKAGEAIPTDDAVVQALTPQKQFKVLDLIHKMAPGLIKPNASLQDAVMQLLADNDKLRRQAAVAPAPGKENQGEVLAGIKRIEASLQNVKDQFSTMRQYGIGAR